jgi:urease accessory protein
MLNVIQPDPDWIVGKHALMNIHAVARRGRTEIDPRSWRIPYQWQGCHYQDHDDQPFLLLINSGGGFVEGDTAQLHGELEPGTRALLTTTSSSRFYKCLEGGTSRELVTVDVGDDALLEYYPDEAIPFAHSRVERRTRIALQPSSRLFATDMISAGRIHHLDGEVFRFTSLFSEFEIALAGRTIALDRLIALDEAEVAALARLWDGAHHMASVYGYAPDLPAGIEDAVEAAIDGVDGVIGGASRIGNLLVARILGEETWQTHEAIYACWSVLRPPLAGKPARPILKC